MTLESIKIELDWEDNLGLFEGPVDHEQDGYMFSFELRLSVEADNIWNGMGSADIWIDDLIVFDPKGNEVTDEDFYDRIKEAITWY